MADAPGETWSGIDAALYAGVRGLRGGRTLADLLFRQRGVLNRKTQPLLTIAQILTWAEAQHALFGAWPSKGIGPIGNTGETWESVNAALRLGLRGLPGGSSLSQLLKEHGKFQRHKSPLRTRKETARTEGKPRPYVEAIPLSDIAVTGRSGRKLRNTGLQHGVSQKKLAELAGLYRSHASSVERGEKDIRLVNSGKLASALPSPSRA